MKKNKIVFLQTTESAFNQFVSLRYVNLAYSILLGLFFCFIATPSVSGQGNFIHHETDDLITLPAINPLQGIQQFTIELWINFETKNDFNILLGYHASSSQRIGMNIGTSTGGWGGFDDIGIWVGNGGASGHHHTDCDCIGLGVWQHIAWVYDGTQASANRYTVYVDGVSVPITAVAGQFIPTSTHATLGQSWQIGGNTTNASMDEVRIWDDIRTPAEITANMNTELAGTEANLVAYYNFNQGVCGGDNTGLAAPQVTDITGNGYDGTMTDMTENGCTSNFVCASATCPALTAPSVVTLVAPVPTLSEWGLIIFVLLIMVSSSVVLIRRRKKHITEG